MGNYASISGLMHASLVGLVLFGAILVVSSITEADFNLREIKISKWNFRRRASVCVVGFMLMIPGLLLLEGTLKGEKQGDKIVNCNVSGSANTSGPNSNATISGCSIPAEPAQ